MNELQPITFHADTIFLVDHQGQPCTPVRPICENLGIDWASQYTKLSDDSRRWNCCTIPTVAADGKQREMLCLPLRKLSGWLMSISPSKVSPEIRDKVLMYQEECDEVLWNYWTRGVALNDRKLAGVIFVDKDKYVTLLEEQNRLLRLEQTVLVQQASTRRNFTAEEDATVLDLRQQGLSQSEIGKRIGRKKGSVSSCLRRLRGPEVQQ